MAKRRIFFSSVICFSITVFFVQTLSQTANADRTANSPDIESSRFNKKIAENLNINWRSIEYEKTLYNPAHISNKQGQPKAESLSLSFEIEKPNSGLILEMCPDAVIEQITDNRGNNIEFDPISSQSSLMYAPNQRFITGSQINWPESHTLRVGLEYGLLERINGDIGIKGYFYALTAESLEYVELPFKPSDKWVRLTPDVEIRVLEARNEASMYQFHIEQRPEIMTRLPYVQIGDYLPSRFVLCRKTITQTGAAGFSGEGAGGSTGIGEKGSGIGRAEKIRYIIAVNPAHQIIPFEIKRIPLLAIADPSTVQTNTSNQKGLKESLEQVKPQFNKEIADCFEVDWNYITYKKILYNKSISGKIRNRKVSEKLSVHCEAEILDSKLIIGTCDIPIIEQITDGKGRDSDISRTKSRSNRMYYNTLVYKSKMSPPSSLTYWEGRARLALGLPLQRRHMPKRTLVLQPVRMKIELDPGLLRRDTGEIGNIIGYFQALTAESSKHIEVPFKPDNKWVKLTSDVEIQVRKAWHTGTAARYDIRQRGRTGAAAYQIYASESLPDGIVVEREFISTGNRPKPPVKFGRSLPGPIGGSGGCDIGRQIEKIDYLIAVDPNHNKIPFELEHIPLPKP